MRLWTWLSGWWNQRKPRCVDVILFTREGCHLCEEAHAQLQTAQKCWGFQLTVVDIDKDGKGLAEALGQCVPVVSIEGRVRFRGRINEVLLTRLLRGLSPATDLSP